jgi:transposase-like protein
MAQDFMKVVLRSALNAELDKHLGYKHHEEAHQRKTNTRNGRSKKTLKHSNRYLT